MRYIKILFAIILLFTITLYPMNHYEPCENHTLLSTLEDVPSEQG